MDQRFTISPDPDAPQAEQGRKLFAGPCDFVKGVVAMDGLPSDQRIEVCFAGRSNVGKSSLINALVGQKNLARSSNTPGRTQEINFFALGTQRFLVDLPGYGFAQAPVAVVDRWQRLMKSYLSGRANLRRIFLLIDARHGPKQVDDEIMSLLDSCAVTFQVVLTKADKIKDKERQAVIAKTAAALAKHPAAFPEMILTSSEKKQGLETLRATIAGIV
jgi:GTP-binding protein